MSPRPKTRAALVAAVMLAGSPVLTLPAPAQAAKAGSCTIVGTAGDDVLIGTDADDVICGLGGDDKILGRGGDDVLRGGGGIDVVRGGPGDDRVAGGRGGDRVFGQGGDDVVRGDSGDDEVVGGPGNDRLGGFRGADEMKGDGDAAGFVDDVRCGPGPDTASADPADEVRRDCETVTQNDPPTDITLAPATISENEPVGTDIGDLTAVDPDPGDSHTFALVPGAGSADNALVRVDGDSLESAAGYDFENDSSFSVRVRATDDAGESTEKAFTITVSDANDAPVAVDDDATTTEDTQLDMPVSGAGSPAANDTDQDGDPLTVSAVTSPTGGTVSISGGQVHFVPATNLCGNDAGSFGYTVSDGDGGTDTGTVTVDITCVDDAPDAVDDARTVAEDSGATTLDVLTNDTDTESDPITIASFTDPAGGTVLLVGPAGAGTNLTYAPDPDFCNDPPPFDTFTYTVNGGDTATVRVTVTCVNDAPVAVDDDRTTDEDTPLQNPVTGAGSPAANDTDVDAGDTLTVTAVTNPTGGTVGIASGQITFTPTANLCGNDAGSYDYTVSDDATPTAGTDTGTVTIDITCVNDAPVANDDSRTVAEDSGPTTFGTLLGNDTDVESDPITITDASNPPNGSTSFTAGDVTYTPDADFCGPDSFTYTVNGGDTATVSVTVTCVNDAPVAVDDSATVGEDDSATAINVLGNDSDVESDAITVSSASDPANGTVALTGPAGAETGLNYTPDPNYCNDPPGTTLDTFTYTINGGDTATVSVTVTCVDDPPVAVDDSASLTMNDGAVPVDVLGNDSDIDGGPIAIASASDPANGTVILTGGTPGAHTGLTYQPDNGYCNTDGTDPDDTFTYTLTPGGDSATVSVEVACDVPPVGVDDSATVGEDSGPNAIDVLANDTNPDGGPKVIASSTDPANGTVVLTGPVGARTGLTYEPDLNYCNTPPPFETFDYTLNGGDTATVSVTVTCVNDDPTAADDSKTVAEDSGATAIDVLANDTDPESDPITISSNTDPANGTVALTGPAGAETGLTYTPDPNYCNDPGAPGDDTFTYTVNGGDTATVLVTVTCVADPPAVNNSAGPTAYTENDPPVAVDSGVDVTNPDGLTITGGSVSITGNVQAGDALDWTDNNLADSIVEGASSTDSVVLTGGGTAAEYEAALAAVTYANSSDNPSTLTRTVTFEITSSAGTASDTIDIDVTAVDDPPTAVNDAATVLEDAAATAVPVLTNDTDVDGGPKTISSASDPANGTVVLTGGSPGAHTGLTYQPDPNHCNDPPGTTPDTFTYTINGGSNATVSMTVTCVNDAPVADDETFNGNDSAHGNTTLQVDDPDDNKAAPSTPHTEIAGDILAGDTDVDGPGPLTITPGTFATNDGGSVTIEADGDFTYLSDPADQCADTSDFFDYTVEDSGSPEQTDTGRVTIAVAGCVWYVHNNSPGNSGTSTAPFDSLAQAETASGNNHTVFVFDGDNTSTLYDTGFAMNSGERLIGEHEGLVVDPDQGGALTADTLHPANPGARPTLTATNEDVVDLDDGNEVRGFNLDPEGAGGGIAGATGDTGGGTIDDVNIDDDGTAGTEPGLELNGTTGTFNVTDFTYDNTTPSVPSAAPGVQLINAGTVAFGSGDAGDPTKINKTGGQALNVLSTNLGTSVFDEITVAASTTGGIELTNITAGSSTTFGDGSGTDLDLTTTGGPNAAFRVSSGAGIVVPASGIADVRATGGPAVDVTSSNGAVLNFDDVDSTNSATDGINLADMGTGTFAALSGDVGGAAGISFDLHDGSGAITYPGNLNNGSGPSAVEITGRDGGSVILSGPISDTNDAGGGVVVSSNNGGSTTLSNATKQFNTPGAVAPANSAVVMSASDGHTLTLSGGGLDIDTTAGKGLEADTSGTIAVTGTGNTIDTTTGRALNISDTDIDNSDVTFQRVSSNGALNGLRLNNTGNANGRLFVTGNGGGCASAVSCTGGAIQNSTQTGVVLNAVPGGAELMRVAVIDSADHGISATNVSNGILLDRSFVSSNGNAVAENGLEYSQVTGVTAIRSSDIIGSGVNNDGGFNARITNTSGTLHLTVNDTDFNLASTDDGLQIGAHGTATIRSNITGNRFDDNKGDAFQVADGAAPGVSSDHTFIGNTIDGKNGTATDGGIAYSTDGSSRATLNSNTITNVSVSGIILNPLGTAAGSTFDATAANNTIGTAGVQQSGSVDGDGMQLKSASEGTSRIVMSNNSISGWQGAGMRMRASEAQGGATTHLTAQSNTIGDEEVDAADAGIWLQAGSSSTDNLNLCANVGGAGGLANTFTTAPVTGAAGIADFVLDLRFANSLMRVPNYTGTTVTDRQNYFLGRNGGFTSFAQDGTQNMTNEADGTCDQPASPTLPTAPPAIGS